MPPSTDELIGLTEARFLGSPERTDALLEKCDTLRAELEVMPRWRFIRRARLSRDLFAYVGELGHNESVRVLR